MRPSVVVEDALLVVHEALRLGVDDDDGRRVLLDGDLRGDTLILCNKEIKRNKANTWTPVLIRYIPVDRTTNNKETYTTQTSYPQYIYRAVQ